MSGTYVATTCLSDALAELPDVEYQALAPAVVPSGRLLNAARDATWDMVVAARRARDGIIIHPANIGRGRAGVKSCVVIHDTMVLDHPEWFDRAYAAYARVLFPLSAAGADLIVTPSESSRSSILNRWSSASVRVLPWPLRTARAASPRAESPSRQVIMIAATEPHKRHDLVIDAIRIARIVLGVDVTLRLVGTAGTAEADVMAYARVVDPDGRWITRAGRLTTAELEAELDNSWVLAGASEDEGFCLPLLEAAGRAVPSVHTGRGATREVMPDGVVDHDAIAIADALTRLDDADAYRAAARRAWERSADFSRERFSESVSNILGELA
jgi:glycosyltransferase involved in cell wall biosynthesis